MTVLPIQCDNCGAKYKLPPTFKGSQAKCQKCGSVIDVAAQRAAAEGAAGGDDKPAAAARPAKPRPAAAAKPAVDRSKTRAPAEKADKPERPARGRAAAAGGGRSRRGRDADAGDEDTPRRGRQKKNDNTPMILGGVGLVAIVVVALIFFMKKDDEKKGDEQANNDPANTAQKADGDNGKPAAGAGDAAAQPAEGAGAGDAKPAEDDAAAKPAEGAGAGDQKPAADEGTGDGESKPAEASTGGGGESVPLPSEVDPSRDKQPWEKLRGAATTMDEVPSATDFGEISWPDSISDEKKAEIMGMVEDLDSGGGIRSIRAKNDLIKQGFPGVFGILEKLRTLDYRDSDDAAFGFELNQAIEAISDKELTARYQTVQAGEEMHPAKAHWNTLTVKAWMGMFDQFPDQAAFEEHLKKKRESKKD